MTKEISKKIFIENAINLGIDQVYFVEPQRYDIQNNSSDLATDPFEVMPSVTCLIVLIKSYKPFLKPEHALPLSSYYIASNALYFAARTLEQGMEAAGHSCERVYLPAKTALVEAGIAGLGTNCLAAIKQIGSFFGVQLLLSNVFEPDTNRKNSQAECEKCNACVAACPVGAIEKDDFKKEKCIRYHLEGQIIPNHIKAKMPGLLGCDVCQRVCKRNRSIKSVSMPDHIQELFTMQNILADYDRHKKEFAEQVGRNMLSKNKLRMQAFILAAHREKEKFKRQAEIAKADQNIALADAAMYYLNDNVT